MKKTLTQISEEAGFRIYKGQKVTIKSDYEESSQARYEVVGPCPKQSALGYVRLRTIRTGKIFPSSVLPTFDNVIFH